jgi:hypothetical protein
MQPVVFLTVAGQNFGFSENPRGYVCLIKSNFLGGDLIDFVEG